MSVGEARVRPFRELEGDTLQVNLHPGQARVRQSKARFVAMLAGTQGGKTCFSPIWLIDQIQRCGAGDYLVVTATYDLFKLKLLPEFLMSFEGGITDGKSYQVGIGRYWAGERIIELAEDLIPGKFWAKQQDDPMWGRIILRSAEAEGGLESATALAAVCDEADHPSFRRTAWEAIQRRLSLTQGRCLFSTSLYRWGWVKTEIYDRWRAGDTDIDVIQFDSTENPAFSRAEYKRAESVLPAWKFNLFYRGRYEKPAGLIYDSFDEATCKISRFPIPGGWPVYVGHDFGCVDEETEVLTKGGWKRQEDLIEGDITLTFNLETGQSEWQPTLKVNRFLPGKCVMRLMEQRGHSSFSTLDHRWPVEKRSSKRVFTTTESLKANDRILSVAECSNLPTEPVYSDSFVELVAWFWTEGQTDAGGVSIWQNEGEKAQQIRRCLLTEFGEPLIRTRNGRERAAAGWLERPKRENVSPRSGCYTGEELCHFAINLNGAERLLKVAPHRIVKPEFITSLTASQLKLFIETSIKGDGWNRRGRGGKEAGQSISQSKSIRLEPLQMACSLLGIRTTLTILESKSLLSIQKRKRLYLSRASKKDVVYDGLIWCPTTPNGTWFARRRGTVYFTGNTANPAALFYAQDPATGYFYLEHEYFPGSRSTAEHVAEFKRLTAGRNVIKRVGGSHQEQGWRNDFTAHGWPIQEPKEHMRKVDVQISQVYALHKLNKIFVFNDILGYLDEKMSFGYKLDDSLNPTNEIEDESRYHRMSCERYILSDFTPETVVKPGPRHVVYSLGGGHGQSQKAVR